MRLALLKMLLFPGLTAAVLYVLPAEPMLKTAFFGFHDVPLCGHYADGNGAVRYWEGNGSGRDTADNVFFHADTACVHLALRGAVLTAVLQTGARCRAFL